MVGLNKIDSSAAYPVDPATIKKADKNEMSKLFDGLTVAPEGAKLSDHSFVCSSSEIAIAYGILDKLFENGQELKMLSQYEILHLKSEIAVPVTLSSYIQHGEFSLEPFIESVKNDLEEKSAAFARMGEVCPINLKGNYPKSFKLSSWFTTKCKLQS